MPGPLAGIRVVDLTALASGPLATAILADQGADVIKIEPPGRGDLMRHMSFGPPGLSSIFAVLNRNKRSLVLNLGDARGKQLLRRLVAGADVFVQNFRPGVVERLGIAEPDLRRVNPELVYASISAFGESGPYAQRKVFDSVIQVLAGFAAAQSDDASGEPRLIRNMICDKLSALTACQAITAALLARSRGQGGQHVRLNMLDASVAFFWPDGMAEQTLPDFPGALPTDPRAVGPRVRGRPRMTLRRAADGYMTVSVIPPDEFAGQCRAIGRPELLADARFKDVEARGRNIEGLEAIVEEFTRGRSTAEISARLHAEGVPHGHVNTPESLLRDPQLLHNALVAEIDDPRAGRMRMPRPVTQFGDEQREIRRPPPGLGEHSDEVLAELGLPRGEIDALRADRVIE